MANDTGTANNAITPVSSVSSSSAAETSAATAAAKSSDTAAATSSQAETATEPKDTVEIGSDASQGTQNTGKTAGGEQSDKTKESDKTKAKDEVEDPEKKKKEDEERLKQIEKEIEELKTKIMEDAKKGDMKALEQDVNALEGLQQEKQKLLQALQPAQNSQPAQAQATPAAANRAANPAAAASPAAATGAPMAATPNTAASTPATPVKSAPIELKGNDLKMANFIDDYLAKQNSPAAGQGAGAMMVQYGKENNVDPLILLAIAGQETQFGKTGIGVNGMLGVGAYDSNPSNAVNNPNFSGVENQIRKGAVTFNNLRSKGGSSANDSIENQLAAANSAGWATDPNWHNGVGRMYNQIVAAAEQYVA